MDSFASDLNRLTGHFVPIYLTGSKMYIPNLNSMTDRNEIVEFMKRFSFATVVTAKDCLPIATHLPFLVSVEDDAIVLASHFAKANEQWKDIENTKVLVIFSEPHAYISPAHYEKELNVPTWNYISVHAYGQGSVIKEPAKVMTLLENTIENYESSYRQQWNQFPGEYRSGMVKGIVAFEIIVKDIQAKKKLSQNRKESEQLNIINSLAKSRDSNEQIIAEYMKKNI